MNDLNIFRVYEAGSFSESINVAYGGTGTIWIVGVVIWFGSRRRGGVSSGGVYLVKASDDESEIRTMNSNDFSLSDCTQTRSAGCLR
jgi:hypothetical protein